MANLKPFKAKNLEITGIKHGFFGREGGVSEGIYQGLNCGFGSNDVPSNVKKNRSFVAEYMGITRENLLNPYQIHSNIAGFIDTPFKKDGPRLDAFVTNNKDIAIAILTADCAPILFGDNINGVIGAAHAGWKGAFTGVIENTIKLMLEKGAKLNNISAAIGPCIEQCSYEVSQEYYDNFIEQSLDNSGFFAPRIHNDELIEGKFLFNLKEYCQNRLLKSGIENIETLPNDTCAEEDAFFSNRRRTHRNEPDYGRNISVIKLI